MFYLYINETMVYTLKFKRRTYKMTGKKILSDSVDNVYDKYEELKDNL